MVKMLLISLQNWFEGYINHVRGVSRTPVISNLTIFMALKGFQRLTFLPKNSILEAAES